MTAFQYHSGSTIYYVLHNLWVLFSATQAFAIVSSPHSRDHIHNNSTAKLNQNWRHCGWLCLYTHDSSHTQYKCQVCPPQSHYLWTKWQSKTITTRVCLCIPRISTRSNCCSNYHGGRTNSSIFWLHTRWSAKHLTLTILTWGWLPTHPLPPPPFGEMQLWQSTA